MNLYVLKRFGWALLTIVFVVVLNFFLFRILPGDPARMVRDPRLTQETVEAIRVRFGLDKPIINCIDSFTPLRLGHCAVNPLETQFFLYVINLLQGNLGTSFHSQRPVAAHPGRGPVPGHQRAVAGDAADTRDAGRARHRRPRDADGKSGREIQPTETDHSCRRAVSLDLLTG